METQEHFVLAAVFFLSLGAGFAGGQQLLQSDGEFTREMDARVNLEDSKAVVNFDGHSFNLTYVNFKEARFYYEFNDSRGEKRIENLQLDGTIQTMRDIKSFGNQTYFLYFRYQDNITKFDDGWMELYRIEEA